MDMETAKKLDIFFCNEDIVVGEPTITNGRPNFVGGAKCVTESALASVTEYLLAMKFNEREVKHKDGYIVRYIHKDGKEYTARLQVTLE